MAKPLLSDELWQRIEPLLPPVPPHPQGGRPWIGNREALTGILFVLRTGIPWEFLTQEMGCGCGMTCWRRLRDWQAAGVWQRLHEVLLAELNNADRIDWTRAIVDSSLLRAMCGGQKTGPNPTDRRKPGSKHHVLTDAQGVPLVVILTGANVHDVKELLPLVDSIPAVGGKPGPPRTHPERVQADTAYDSKSHRQALHQRGITQSFRIVCVSMAADWVCIAGSWNGQFPGFTTSVVSASAGNDARTFMKRSSILRNR